MFNRKSITILLLGGGAGVLLGMFLGNVSLGIVIGLSIALVVPTLIKRK